MRPSEELLQRAYALADSAAISDIESWCTEWEDSTREARWYDTTSVINLSQQDMGFVDEALRYLALRGILIRKLNHPHVVGFDRSRVQEAP